MSLALNKPKLDNLTGDIWKSAERLRGKFKAYEYQGVILTAHRDDRVYLEGAYRGQVNAEIQSAYTARDRYEELADPKYMDAGGIFDIMAVTVIDTHLAFAV